MAKLIPYGKQFIDKTDKRLVIESLSNDLITKNSPEKKAGFFVVPKVVE